MSSPALSPISQDDFVADVKALAALLAVDHWTPDYLIGVGRGGLVPAAYLSHASGVTLLSVDYSSKEFSFADALLHKLAAKTVAGQKLLIVDDINDSGKTITELRQVLAREGGVADHVRVAVLMNNIRSHAVADYWAREIDRDTDKRWFVFPWEAMAPADVIVEDAEAVPERLA
ncbi:phosphoribosyltransferase [Sphingobium aquiterrae]|uniref:phosphoribosyltransferase n=1 Tax=Sphingobium aquiterrae TaxID=2038656 RepID=UPI0030199901